MRMDASRPQRPNSMDHLTQPRMFAGEWVSSSAEETFLQGRRIGEQLAGGEILLISGPLGAGKTVLVKGIASGLGIDPQEVTSPSFTLVNVHFGRLTLYHVDLYRLGTGTHSAAAVDLDELLADDKAVLAIEWAERLGAYPLPKEAFWINISGDGDDARKITVSGF
jgi:tRNA threonylcarbamoyladenosine biosynthesis protein TsaE